MGRSKGFPRLSRHFTQKLGHKLSNQFYFRKSFVQFLLALFTQSFENGRSGSSQKPSVPGKRIFPRAVRIFRFVSKMTVILAWARPRAAFEPGIQIRGSPATLLCQTKMFLFRDFRIFRIHILLNF